MNGLNSRLMTQDGMRRTREAAMSKHEWFVHASPVKYFDSIQKTGFQPRDPYIEGVDGSGDDRSARRVVCLTPIPSGTDTRPRRGERQFLVAVRSCNLPPRVGVDRSYGQDGLIDLLDREFPERDLEDVFSEVIYRWGCLVCYDPIVPEHLHVRAEGLPIDDPSEWPLLSDCSFDDVATM